MKPLRNCLLAAVLALCPGLLHAGRVFEGPLHDPCTAQTLAAYTSEGFGCSIDIIDFTGFSFSSFGSQNSLATSSDILVTPLHNGFGFSRVDGQPFVTPAGQDAHYRILYDFIIDPAPIIEGADLTLDPPEGAIVVTQYYCTDGSFAFGAQSFGIVCENDGQIFLPQTLIVTPENPTTGFVPFSKPAFSFGSVLTAIDLTGPGQFDAVLGNAYLQGEITPVPEPSAFGLGMAGMGLLAAWHRKVKPRG